MKVYKSSDSKGNFSDKIFMIVFLVIFSLCFLPFFLKKVNVSRQEAAPAYVDTQESDISGPGQPEEIFTVADKPGKRLHYSSESIDGLTDDIISSDAAILYDRTSDIVLYSKNAQIPVFPASTTKIVTACAALRYLKPDHRLTVGTELSMLQPESSLAYLRQGNELTLEDALYALLLPSGNDAAYVIAVNTARYVAEDPSMSDEEAVRYFAELMNDEAYEAGAEHTHFCVPDGYHDPFHYTTAEDMLKISIRSAEYPLIAEIVSRPFRETTILSGDTFYWSNGNCLVTNDNEYYLPFATGLKTGFTDEAGYCMAATASDGDHDLIAVIMKAPSLAGRYTDAAKLFYSVTSPSKFAESLVTTSAEQTPEPDNSEPEPKTEYDDSDEENSYGSQDE